MNEPLKTRCSEDWPYTRIQGHVESRKGVPVEFVYQLEYNMSPHLHKKSEHDWRQVARFDHQHGGTHDIRHEGLHMDVYRDGHKERIVRDFPDIEIKQAPNFCLKFLKTHKFRLIERFEEWHEVSEPIAVR